MKFSAIKPKPNQNQTKINSKPNQIADAGKLQNQTKTNQNSKQNPNRFDLIHSLFYMQEYTGFRSVACELHRVDYCKLKTQTFWPSFHDIYLR
jgi:hypothetical protein